MAIRWVYSWLTLLGSPHGEQGKLLSYMRGTRQGKRVGHVDKHGEASHTIYSPCLVSPCLIWLAICNVQIYSLGWNVCISYITSNGATSLNCVALLLALHHVINSTASHIAFQTVPCHERMPHHETVWSLNGAMSPTAAVLLMAAVSPLATAASSGICCVIIWYYIIKAPRYQMAPCHQWPPHCHDWSILSVMYKMQFHREIWVINTL